MVSSV